MVRLSLAQPFTCQVQTDWYWVVLELWVARLHESCGGNTTSLLDLHVSLEWQRQGIQRCSLCLITKRIFEIFWWVLILHISSWVNHATYLYTFIYLVLLMEFYKDLSLSRFNIPGLYTTSTHRKKTAERKHMLQRYPLCTLIIIVPFFELKGVW